MAQRNVAKTLKQLSSELRSYSSEGNLKNSLLMKYILQQYKKYKVTDQQLCKAQQEMKYLSESYLCYLQSQRKYMELNKQYKGKGERSVEETAGIVGFNLPHDPKKRS